MNKNIQKMSHGVKIVTLSFVAFLLAGCGGSSDSVAPEAIVDASVLRSVDGGSTFEPMALVNDNTTLAGIDILSFAFHPTNRDIFYVGTAKNGIYRTANKGELWESIFFPPQKVYALAVDPQNGDHLYATGVYENVSKLYVSENAGTDWKEIYTEPGKGSVLTVVAIDPKNAQHILMGTSEGVISQSRDGGISWSNVSTFEAAITQIVFVEKASGTVLALIQGKDIVLSQDSGSTWLERKSEGLSLPEFTGTEEETKQTEVAEINQQNTVVVDQYLPGTLYAGTNGGLFKSQNYGATWQPLNILESSKSFSLRAVAVNPKNSSEIVYVAGSAFYKSKDGGTRWSTVKLPISRGVNMIHYDPVEPQTLYLTERK
jgi:photosystem II stability/assembly factor-like uncharacterized protein